MKKIFLFITAALLFLNACQHPDPLLPPISRDGINNFVASFVDDDSGDNVFTSEINHENQVITVVFPYNYPLGSNNVITLQDLSKMRVKADLDDNVFIEPKILYMDLSKENTITIIDQRKERKEYKVVADIRKSSESSITKYNLPESSLNGVINDNEKTISFVTVDELGELLADITISHGATISPDPRETALNYDEPVEVTVTAQDGVTQTTYTVIKSIPSKVPNGMRPGSRVILWEKTLAELGISNPANTTGLSVTDDFVMLNTRNENSVYVNSLTGQVLGTYDLGSTKGLDVNYYSTADRDNNILISNRAGVGVNPVFTIWKVTDLDASPEPFIEWATELPIGRKFSIQGSIDANAIISAPIYQLGGQFARWQVIDGALVSQTPEIITSPALSWTTNADVVYSDDTDLNSDYFASYYGSPAAFRQFTWVNGTTNDTRVKGDDISGNWIPNAVDYITFNNNSYVVHNSVNSFTWGSDDSIYLYDLAPGNFSSRVDAVQAGAYGARALGNVNASAFGDVAFKVSENGYYMYLYIMFANGYVVCVQYDCIDM